MEYVVRSVYAWLEVPDVLGRLLTYGSSCWMSKFSDCIWWLYAISRTCASMLIRLVQEQYIEENNSIVLEGAKGLHKSTKEWYNFKLLSPISRFIFSRWKHLELKP